MFDLDKLVRANIKTLKPYSSARSEFGGEARVFLDANENSFGSPLDKWYNRYPDPQQKKLKEAISAVKNVPVESMLLGNGSDECIDLLFRAFCEPGRDRVLICPPTYGMYEVYAHINNVAVDAVPLLAANFQLDLEGIEQALTAETKMIFICSPNNPTGNAIYRDDIEAILNNFDGLVVVDEAYINYSRSRSFLSELKDYPNLVVLQTFSKAWGLAALRLGVAYASPGIIGLLNTIKPPYNINGASQELAMQALGRLGEVNAMIRETVDERGRLAEALRGLHAVERVFATDANFLLIRVADAGGVYHHLLDAGIVVRNRSHIPLCEGCLRITVGTPSQNDQLINVLNNYPNA